MASKEVARRQASVRIGEGAGWLCFLLPGEGDQRSKKNYKAVTKREREQAVLERVYARGGFTEEAGWESCKSERSE